MKIKQYTIYLLLFLAAILLLFFLAKTECPKICRPCNDPDKICIKPTTGNCSKHLFCQEGDKNCICV